MIPVEVKREALRGVYPYPKWQDKVDKMSENQVHTVYARFLAQKKL